MVSSSAHHATVLPCLRLGLILEIPLFNALLLLLTLRVTCRCFWISLLLYMLLWLPSKSGTLLLLPLLLHTVIHLCYLAWMLTTKVGRHSSRVMMMIVMVIRMNICRVAAVLIVLIAILAVLVAVMAIMVNHASSTGTNCHIRTDLASIIHNHSCLLLNLVLLVVSLVLEACRIHRILKASCCRWRLMMYHYILLTISGCLWHAGSR